MKHWLVLTAVLLLSATLAMAEDPGNDVKWSQLPDMNMGMDWSSEVKIPSTVADDWLCTNGLAITDIHWWGSYWLPVNPTPPDGSPNSDSRPDAAPGGIEQFVIKIWSDVPANPSDPFSFSKPGQLLQTYGFTIAQCNEVLFGVTQGGGGVPAQNVYQYYVVLDRPFEQVQGQIYWLSIEAVMRDATGAWITDKQWGWHESKDHWNDAAVQDFKYSGWYALQNNLYDVDMAFELTVPEPGSMLALGAGLIGLVGFAARKRRA